MTTLSAQEFKAEQNGKKDSAAKPSIENNGLIFETKITLFSTPIKFHVSVLYLLYLSQTVGA